MEKYKIMNVYKKSQISNLMPLCRIVVMVIMRQLFILIYFFYKSNHFRKIILESQIKKEEIKLIMNQDQSAELNLIALLARMDSLLLFFKLVLCLLLFEHG